MLVLMVYGVIQNLYVFILYHNPNLNDWIFDCFIALMTAVQSMLPSSLWVV